MAKKPKKKRDLREYPGLDRRLFSKIKQEYHDIDYADQLDDEAKKWLSQFMEEDLGAQLNEETLKNKYGREPLNKSAKQRKGCFDRNNHRNVDIYSLGRATGRLTDISSPIVQGDIDSTVEEDYEDFIIDKIDKTK